MKKIFLLFTLFFCILPLSLSAIEKTYSDKKFYDQNKNDSLNQKSACWAASTANILKAWQDYLKKNYYYNPPLGTPSTLNEIYERVYSFGYLKSQKVKAESNSTVNGIAWFISGMSYDTETKRLEHSDTGGFYKNLYKGVSSPKDLVKLHNLKEDNISLKALELIFENALKKDSKISIGISCDDEGVPSHAITFWGYETKNNRLSSIFVTDSDDNHKGKKEYKIYASDNKIYLSNYSLLRKYYIRNLVEFNILLPPKIKDRYVSAESGDNNNSGVTWQKAFKSLDAAINSIKLVATNEEEYTIHMEEGTYSFSSDILNYSYGNNKGDVKVQNNIENTSFKILGGYSKTSKSSPRTRNTFIVPTIKSPMSLVYVKNSKITFDSIIFDAKNQTKGLLATNNSSLTLNNCTVKNTISDSSGAGIYCEGILNVKNSDIFNNKSKATGGAIYSKGTLNIYSSSIYSNSGGAIYSQGKLNIDRSKINDNTSPKSGAGIVSMGDAFIKNSSIFKNKSDVSVAGLYVKGYLRLLNSTIAKNHAKECGAMYIDSAKASIDYCTIAENTSTSLINIHLKAGLSLSLNNSIIWKNNMSYLTSVNAKNSLIDSYKSKPENNLFNSSEYLKEKYNNALIWDSNAYYKPSSKLLITKDKSEQKDQLGKDRNIGCIGSIEYN